jgi:hypothetical protein
MTVYAAGAQKRNDSTLQNIEYQKDIFDVLWKKRNEKPEQPTRKVRAIILPLVAYSPTTSVQIGVGTSLSYHIGNDPSTKLSAGTGMLTVTARKQLIFQLKNNLFSGQNKWFFQTDWRFYVFPLPTYGLGTAGPDEIPPVPGEIPPAYINTDLDGKYPMSYDWVKFHNVLSRKIIDKLYAGVGYHLDYYFNIKDDAHTYLAGGSVATPHYSYCRIHGFDTSQYLTSGLSLNFIFDSRDNIINAYKGFYVNASYRYNLEILGSQKSGSLLWTEFRAYVGLSKVTPRHLLAFWVFGSFLLSGDIPYLTLMSSGFDQMNSSGRGYSQGRWRGEDFAYGEMEYRFPISPRSKVLGGVLFANLTTASNRDMGIPLFGYFKPGVGFGLRIMVGKYDRTNISIDFGLGYKSQGFYVQAQEIF